MSPKSKSPKSPTVFVFDPVGFDMFSPHPGTPEKGALVVKTQPSGCPRNGTMGHCYVADAETGEFYGLVLVNSLRKATKAEKEA